MFVRFFYPIVLVFVAGTQQWAELGFPQLPLGKKWANTRTRRHLLQRVSEDAAAVKLVVNWKQQLRGHTVP